MKWDIAVETRPRAGGGLDVISIIWNGCGARINRISTAETEREAIVNELGELQKIMSSRVVLDHAIDDQEVDPAYLVENIISGGKNA